MKVCCGVEGAVYSPVWRVPRSVVDVPFVVVEMTVVEIPGWRSENRDSDPLPCLGPLIKDLTFVKITSLAS